MMNVYDEHADGTTAEAQSDHRKEAKRPFLRNLTARLRLHPLLPFAALAALGALLTGCGGVFRGGQAPGAQQQSLIDQEVRVFVEGGAWTWFNDERARFVGPYLYIGHVSTEGYSSVTAFPLDEEAGPAPQTTRLSSFQEVDDHDNPALLHLADGRTLATYAQHGEEPYWYWRFENADPQQVAWSPEQRTEALGDEATYNNLFQLSEEEGRIYNFFRGLNWDPTLMTSEDGGQTWSAPQHFMRSGTDETRPYVKYASDGAGRIDLLYTQAHPRATENNVYHLYYEGGTLHKSDGTPICQLSEADCLPVPVEAGTKIYDAEEAGRGWVWDIEYAEGGTPVGAYITARDDSVGNDLRYRYARYDGAAGQWQEQEIAHAGTRLYEGENHYAGGIAIDPAHVNTVYLSANVNPETGDSTATRRYQIYQGTTGGETWTWTQVTESPSADNLRPFVPRGSRATGHRAVLWLRGRYTAYENYGTNVVGLLE